MNDSCYDASNTSYQDAAGNAGSLLEEGVESKPEYKPALSDHIRDCDYYAWLTIRRCYKPSCTNLRFTSERDYLSHVLSHITQPKVLIQRLDLNILLEKNCVQLLEQGKKHASSDKHEPLRVRLKLKSKSGSQKRSFEVIQSPKVLSGPGGLYCANGVFDIVKTEFQENTAPVKKGRSSERKPDCVDELDEHSIAVGEEEGAEEEEGDRNSQEDPADSEDGVNSGDGQVTEDQECDRPEEDGGEESCEEEVGERNSMPPWGDAEQESGQPEPTESAPASPTPSEVLRPHGYLAPEQLVDDDSCYPRSPPGSPSRMVEMNGSASTVGGSDNDSGHSRSPATFPGNPGAGSGGEEDSAGQFWDELVSQTSDSNAPVTSNESGGENGSTGAGTDDTASAEADTAGERSVVMESDPLLLPENSAATGEQENLNLLQNLTGDPLHTSEVDRGDTEYMSLDRLGEAAFCCEVCGERTQDRRILEEHRAVSGHYKCSMPECSQMLWSSSGELASHQATVHGQQQHSPQQSTQQQHSPSPRGGTPPVQQLAQQVQRLPIPQQPGYPATGPAAYPVVPQQQLSPQMGPQMSSQMPPQMPPQMVPQMPPQMAPHMPPQMGPAGARRPPMGYRMPMPGQPFGPGSPGQQQATPYQPQASFSGTIHPRPLNTLVAAQQPVRGQMQARMAPGVNAQSANVVRGMGPVSVRGQKRPGVPMQGGRGMPTIAAAKQRRVEGAPMQQEGAPGKKSDAKAVANILATRGITVTPAGMARPGPAGQQGAQVRQRQPMMAPAPPQPVPTLNLNSAISIIPTSASTNSRQQNNSGFAVPQGRSVQRQPQTTNVERPPRPPTVDLTGDGPNPPPGSTRLQMAPTFHRGRGRPSNLSRTTCQICDKTFTSPEMLNQHMAVHRSPGKLPYRCNLCNAQYPTQQGLQQHRQTYHKEAVGLGSALVPGEEMVIPLVDLKQPGVAARLGSLGIHHCIPLSGLGNQSNGYFSLPVVSIDGSRTSAAGNLRSLGASGVLSIGPIKLVPR